jgi:hypothetical protein
MNFNVIEYLNELKDEQIYELVEILNYEHIVLDESRKYLSSIIIEKWNDECTKFLIERGLECESLCTTAYECSHLGWIYALFNCDEYEYSEVRDYIDRYCKKNLY